MNEAVSENWSTRALERQINSLYYERLLLSRNDQPVIEEAKEMTDLFKQVPTEFIKKPMFLNFWI